MTGPRLFVSRGWVGVGIGRWYLSLRSPARKPYFSERNRIHCRVLTLGRGWRFVLRVES